MAFHNGKGVFFDVVQSLVGRDNCSQVPLSRFNDQFALYGTFGKLLNCTNESRHVVSDEAEMTLKSFVAGDTFTFERKFKEPVSGKPTAKVMIATNALPRFNDKSQGIWRRILLVPFLNIIPEDRQDKDLADHLKEELPGILNWALEGLRKLDKADKFITPEDNVELIDEYRRDADPARAFLLENFAESNNGEAVSCKELYQRYSEWCDVNGCKRMNNRTFGQQIKRVFPGVDRSRLRNGNERDYVYRGIRSYE